MAALISILAMVAEPGNTQQQAKTPSTPKTWTQPKTPWGDPDIQGTWTSDDCIGTPMNRPAKFGDRLNYTEQELAENANQIAKQHETDLVDTVASGARVSTGPPAHWGERARRPCRQTSLVVDPPNGQTPELVPEAKTRPRKEDALNNNPKADSWEDFTEYIRCITRGVAGSIFPVIYGNGQEIVQGIGFVSIMQEMVHEARVIPLDGRPHASPNIRTYMGDPRGHWEGNTLVVETTNFTDRTAFRGSGEHLHLIERFTRTGAGSMDYEFTMNDPESFTKPWTARIPMAKVAGPIYEYACNEGNYGLTGSLSGARAEEKRAEEAKKGSR
jgi:hypothetical protein